jgi:hypothetical protein
MHYLRTRSAIPVHLVSLLAIVQIAFCIWIINKGFDFTDEAYSFLGIKNTEETGRVATYYTIILDTLFGWLNLTIVNVRVLRLLFILLCGGILAHGLSQWFAAKVNSDATYRYAIFTFVIVGSLLTNANGSQSLTYNLMSSLILQTAAGLYLLSFQNNYLSRTKTGVIFFFVGFLVFSLFMVKFSSAILLLALVFVMIAWDKANIRVILMYLVLIFIGALAAGLLFFGRDLFLWFGNYLETLEILARQSTGSIWQRYLEDYEYTKSSKIVSNLLYISIFTILLIVNFFIKNQILRIGIVLVTGSVMVYIAYTNDYYLGGPPHYYTYTGLYIIVLFALFCCELVRVAIRWRQKQKQHGGLYMVACFLLALPLCGIVGTSNLPSIQLIWYTSFLFAAVFLLLYLHGKYVLSVMIVVLGVNATLAGVSGIVYFPYRINGTLFDEKQSVGAPMSDEKIKVNAELLESIKSFHRVLTNETSFVKGDPIFATSPDYFGFIYLSEGVLPGWGWYDEKATPYNCYCLKNTNVKSLDRMIVLMPSYYKMDSLYVNCLADMGVRFPDDYSPVDSVAYHMGTLNRTFTIFAPQRILKNKE